MRQKTFGCIVLLVLILGFGTYFLITQDRINHTSPGSVLVLSKKIIDTGFYGSTRSGDPRSIRSVQVIKDEPNILELRVTYFYDGEEGTGISTCGGVINEDMSYPYEWSCMPSKILEGENTLLYLIKLISERSTADYYCTDIVRVAMYRGNKGGNYLNQFFAYKKSWVNGGSFLDQFKQLVLDYTKCA